MKAPFFFFIVAISSSSTNDAAYLSCRGDATLMRFLCFRERNLSRHPLDLSRLSLPSFLLTLAVTNDDLRSKIFVENFLLFLSSVIFVNIRIDPKLRDISYR